MPPAPAEPTTVEARPTWERGADSRCGSNGVPLVATSDGATADGATASQPRLATDSPPQRPVDPLCGDPNAGDDCATPPVDRAIMWAQTAVEAAILSREDEAWGRERLSGCDAILQLTELNVAIPLVEVYRRIVLDD